MMAHMGEDSLDAIATRVYGREYKGQQTGDMIYNDSHVVYDMSAEAVEELNSEMSSEPKRHYLDYDPITEEHKYAEGVNWFEYWLGLEEKEIFPGYTDMTDIIRAAPTPNHVLADLIKRGELPYGTYVMSVWW